MTSEERAQRIYNVHNSLRHVSDASRLASRHWASCDIRSVRRDLDNLDAYVRLARMAIDNLTEDSP